MLRRILLALTLTGSMALGLGLASEGVASACPISQCSSPMPGALSICNGSTQPSTILGVIHTPDGSYPNDQYDAGLHGQGMCSRPVFGWPHSGGIYIPTETGMQIYDHAGHFLRMVPDRNHSSVTWFFFGNPNETYSVVPCLFLSTFVCSPF